MHLVPARDAYKGHLVITNLDFQLEPPRPLMPNIIPIPALFVKEPQPIKNTALRDFVDNAEKGVIVIILLFFFIAFVP